MLIALLIAILLQSATPAHATADVYVIGWVYASGREVPPELVTIAITGGSEAWRDIGPRGGTIALRTPGGRACYQVTIHAPPLVFTRSETSECQAQAAPSLTGQWTPSGYLVTWQSPQPACVTVQQSGGLETLVGDCAVSGEVLLIRAGSYAIAAIPGAVVRLRAADGLGLLGELTIPDAPVVARVALPLIVVP